MKSAILPLLFCTMIMSACAAAEKPQESYRPSSGPPSNPLSRPYEERLKQFEQGNLVTNHSFEDGRYLTGDPANTFILTGWEKVGININRVIRDEEPDKNKTFNNDRHCIKISRNKANETDTAEGIISDYIRVIPGNYDFTYNIKLENILSNKHRLGVQLYDAITINVLFFDEGKQPIDAAYLNPVRGNLIDNSDKGYSFSNFWRIDNFPWGKVRGRSYNYPFSEGDIPARTRYVRLFFGLKGTGTIWLDDIYFGYSKWNFTALERFKPFFGRPLTLDEKIIPTPKSFQEIGAITYFGAESPPSHLPVIVLPENPAPAERSAARILQKKINGVLDEVIPAQISNNIRILEKDLVFEDISNAKLIISIGTNSVYHMVQPDLPLESIHDQPQGYVIQTEQVGNTHVVFLMGRTPIGNFNAAATAIQLFESEKFIYHNANVVDYPDFLSRSYVFKNWKNEKELHNDLNAVERMSLYKLNKVYVGYGRTNKNWYQPDALYRKGLFEAGRLFKERGVMHLALMVNPYSHFAMEAPVESLNDELRYTWTHSRPESFRMLKEVYQIGLEAGADTIMLLSDDFVPHSGTNPQNYALYSAEDKKHFVNLQNAQAHIINKLKAWIDRDYPGTRIEFCPPWYSNEHIDRSNGKAEVYFKELSLQIPRDVAIIWTGPTIRSLSIDMADLHRYSSLIGRWPMIWDNTLYARNIEAKRYGGYTTHYPDKVKMCNLFEPYDTDMPKDFHKFNDRRQIYTNGEAYTEIYKIKYATVADYEWNTTAYDPERSLWKTLIRTYGPAGAQKLIRFSDAYYDVYGICRRMELQGVNKQYVRNGKQRLTELNDCLQNISGTLPENKTLFEELKQLTDKQKNRFEKLSQGVQ